MAYEIPKILAGKVEAKEILSIVCPEKFGCNSSCQNKR
jgi:hypothetical protein